MLLFSICRSDPSHSFPLLSEPTKSPALILTPTLPPGGHSCTSGTHTLHCSPPRALPASSTARVFHSNRTTWTSPPRLYSQAPLFSHYTQYFLWPLLALPDQAPRGGSCHSAPIPVHCASPHSLLLQSTLSFQPPSICSHNLRPPEGSGITSPSYNRSEGCPSTTDPEPDP